jgi:Ca2+-transporting ATPase
MMDTPREGVAEAVSSARKAGIRVVMTTGDHKETAIAIARRVGIMHTDERSFEQSELEKMNEREFLAAVKSAAVFARLSPEMKLRITEALQHTGKIVAVTGDGVNDALALTRSDIGVAMGRNGSDVAKQAGDIVLTDDNFASIVSAIEEGRLVFNNVQRSSSFLVTTSFAEQTMIFGALSLSLPLPFNPTQILWLNLVTDGVTDIAIAAEPSHGRALSSPPRKSDESILSWEIFPYLLLLMSVMAAISLATFVWFLPEGVERARAAAFTVLSATQLFNMFNMRSLRQSVFSIGILKNRFAVAAFVFSSVLLFLTIYAPPFQKLFSFSPIAYWEFFLLFLLSASILLVGELYKYFRFAKR